jgi:hypothetical protein
MKVSKIGNIMLFLGILSVMVVCAGAVPAQAGGVSVSVVVTTSVTSGVPFTGTVKITNNGDSPIKVKRWFITYVVPSLIYKGPYEIFSGTLVKINPGQSISKPFSLKISEAKGVVVPVIAGIQGEKSHWEYSGGFPTPPPPHLNGMAKLSLEVWQ